METKEIKICSECGKALPISEFHTWKHKDGSIGVLHQCLHCQRTKANRRYAEKRKLGEISKFDTRIIVKELERRGLIMDNGCINLKSLDYERD